MEFYPCPKCEYSRLTLSPAFSTAQCLLVTNDRVPHECYSKSGLKLSPAPEIEDAPALLDQIPFSSLDYDMRLKFLQFCSPVFQNDLIKVSKLVSGRSTNHPKNFVAEEVVISRYRLPLDRSSGIPSSSVVEARRILKLENLAPKDLLEYKNTIKFKHSNLKLFYSEFEEKELQFVFNPNIKIAHIISSLKNIKIRRILDSMPNLKIFYFCPIGLEIDWCFQILKWRQTSKLQLFSLSLHDRIWITTLKPKLLAKFFLKQGKYFKMELHFSFVRKSETSRFDFYSFFEPSFDGERCQQLIVYYYKNIVHLKPKKLKN
ncbi:hypothetical protein FO519_005635 [Halicephalobus sp. NKZ332]|nr:hypothetical protein FO519_005635 [Halicephalobus sp. NKZ332]